MQRRTEDLLRAVPLVDGHNDLPWAMRIQVAYDFDAQDPARRLEATQTDLVRMREGGVGAQFWSVYVPSTLQGGAAVTATLEQIDFVHRLIARNPDHLGLALTAADVENVFAGGRIASLLGAEGGHSIDGSLGVLRDLYRLGVRYMTLTHNDNIPWADAATDEPAVGGLTDFGRDVVREMNRIGMLVDLSHVATTTMWHALETTTSPVIFSHSSCRQLVDHVRNVPDEVLRELTGNGGVCMVAFVPDFVSEECRQWRLAGDAEAPRPVATVSHVADHIEHVREVAGVEHVGLGADYDGCDYFPEGLSDVSSYPALLEELIDRRWSDGELGALIGGNALRVLRDAEAASDRLGGISAL